MKKVCTVGKGGGFEGIGENEMRSGFGDEMCIRDSLTVFHGVFLLSLYLNHF